MSNEALNAIARLQAAIDTAVKDEMAKLKEHDGVIVRPGDVILYKGNKSIVVINMKTYLDARPHCLDVAIPITGRGFGIEHFSGFNSITTLDGRPVIGFRDNDEVG